MLYSNYSKNKEKLAKSEPMLSNLRTTVLAHLGSSRWYNQLEGILPENWDKNYSVVLYTEPDDVLKNFKEEISHRDSIPVKESKIITILASKKEDTVPGRYIEFNKRDNEFPYEANKWTIHHDSTVLIKPIFHVDHRLIWITGDREINFFSTEDIKKVPFKHTIHVYTPDVDVLTKVQYMKFSDLE